MYRIQNTLLMAVALVAIAAIWPNADHSGPVLAVALAVGVTRKSLELKTKATKVYEEGKSILAKVDAEKRDPTTEEHATIKGLGAQYDALMDQATEAERWENREAHRSHSPGAPAPLEQDEDEGRGRGQGRKTKVFHSLGHQLQATYALATSKIPGGAQFESLEQARNMMQAAATGAGEAIDSEGGFLLEPTISQDIEAGMREAGAILSLIPNTIEVDGAGLVEKFIDETSRATGSRSGAIRTYWIGEGDDITASKVKFSKRKTDLGKLAGAAYFSEEILSDASAISGIYREAFVEDLTFMVEDAVFEGDGGVDKPLGVKVHAGTISVAKATGQAAATFNNQNISDMWVRLLTRSKSKAVWLINGELGPQIDQLSIPAGTAALEPRFVTYDSQGVLRIKGRPVIEVEYCEALGTVGDVMLADFSGYRFIKKGGINQAMSMHVRFLNDEQVFRVTYRVGGQPKNKTVITPFKGSLTRSYFVTLATRS